MLASWLAQAELPGNVALYVVSSYVKTGEPNYPPSAWLQGMLASSRPDVDVLVDTPDSEVAEAFGAHRLPFWVLLDASNEVLARYAGQLSTSELDSLVGAIAAGASLTLPAHGWQGDPAPTGSPEPEPTQTTEREPGPTPQPTTRADGEFTAGRLMSMVGWSLTDADIADLARVCLRDYLFRQDIHCEDVLGFGLSADGDTVREVYLYDYFPPDQSSFRGALPGGVSWNSTLADIIDTLGRPECVTSIIGYGLHYTIDGLDVEYTVTANMEPTADLQTITIRAAADRPADCHPYTR